MLVAHQGAQTLQFTSTQSHTISKGKDTAFTVFQSVKGHPKERRGRHAIFSLDRPYLLLWALPTLGKLLLQSPLPPLLQEQSIGLFYQFYFCQHISPHLHSPYLVGAFTSSALLWDHHTSNPLCLLPSLYFSQACQY